LWRFSVSALEFSLGFPILNKQVIAAIGLYFGLEQSFISVVLIHYFDAVVDHSRRSFSSWDRRCVNLDLQIIDRSVY